VYDWLTTIEDEIEYIWKRDITVVTLLFFLNRYFALFALSFMVSMVVLPAFTPEICKKFIEFQPFGYGIPLTILPDIVIGLRVYALYGRNRLIGIFLVLYLVAELGLGFWIYLTPSLFVVPIPGPESITNSVALHWCQGAPSAKLSSIQVASFQIMQTVFDTMCLALILAKTISESLIRGRSFRSVGGIQALIVKHGVIYYVVVFTSNFTWAMMILLASVNLKYAVAGVALALAPLSANRLTIFLRKYNAQPVVHDETGEIGHRRLQRRPSWIGTSTFEPAARDTLVFKNAFESYQFTTQSHISL